jgi:hypothetical protein
MTETEEAHERFKREAKQFPDQARQIMFRTIDPTVLLDGRPVPAMTTLLYSICDNDPDKFEEATRIVQLFISEALNVRT